MYESLREWINIPVTIIPFVRRSGTGAKTFGESVDALCYAQGEAVSVKNSDGEEVVSHTQLYFDADVSIKVTDKVRFDGTESDIQSISTFYRNGKADMRVVYL